MSLGVANPTIWELVSKHHTVEETCRYVQSGNLKKKVIEVKSAKQVLVDCIKRGINVVCYSDDEYPKSLKDIHNPPSVLFYRGNLNLLNNEKLLTVVGTRNPVDYTVRVTSTICDGLVHEGFVLISGFAVGVDSIAHRSAISNHKPTVSVLACCLDYDYPKGTSNMKNEILSNGGLILTEQLPDTPPYRANFPKRNRILAGLGNGTLITEASLSSGSLITANYSYSMDKPIFCVPPSDIFDRRFLGLAKYIRDGAICIFSHNDIIYEYYGSYPSKVRNTNIIQINDAEEVSQSPIFKDDIINQKQSIRKKSKDVDSKESSIVMVGTPKSIKSTNPDEKVEVLFSNFNVTPKGFSTITTKEDLSSLSDKQLLVIQSIKRGYNYLDDIANDTNIDISDLFEIITDLEVIGKIKSDFGNKYVLNVD